MNTFWHVDVMLEMCYYVVNVRKMLLQMLQMFVHGLLTLVVCVICMISQKILKIKSSWWLLVTQCLLDSIILIHKGVPKSPGRDTLPSFIWGYTALGSKLLLSIRETPGSENIPYLKEIPYLWPRKSSGMTSRFLKHYVVERPHAKAVILKQS